MDTRFQSLFDGCLDIDPAQAAPDLAKAIPSGKGILLFADSADRPIQLLSTASMRAAALARLAPQAHPAPTKRVDLSAVIARIHYVSTFCDLRSILRYREIAMALYPGEYRKIMNLPRTSLVSIDMADMWPRFSVTQKVSFSVSLRMFGPFPTRKAATVFAGALNNAFMLCHNPGLAANRDKARSCPYLQMNTCPAPCVGSSPREDYLMRLELALRTASGERRELAEAFRERMLSLAAERLFEAANQAKLSLQALEPLADAAYRWTTDLSRFAVMHIDRSRKVKIAGSRQLAQSYSVFVLRPGRIDELSDITLPDLPGLLAGIPELLAAVPVGCEPLLTDSVSIIQSLLYRSTPPGILLDLGRPMTPEDIAALLAARFARPDAIAQ